MRSLEILVVDDEQSICLLLRDVLARFGHQVTTCQDSTAALEIADERKFDLIFLDIRMPGMNGLDALKKLRDVQSTAKFVMITGFAKDDIIQESLRSGASTCLCKPFRLSQVVEVLKEMEVKAPVEA